MTLSDYPELSAIVNKLLDDLDVAEALVEARGGDEPATVLSTAMANARPSRRTTRANDLGIVDAKDARRVWLSKPAVGRT